MKNSLNTNIVIFVCCCCLLYSMDYFIFIFISKCTIYIWLRKIERKKKVWKFKLILNILEIHLLFKLWKLWSLQFCRGIYICWTNCNLFFSNVLFFYQFVYMELGWNLQFKLKYFLYCVNGCTLQYIFT